MRAPAERYWVFASLVVGGALTDLASKSWIFNWRGMPNPNQPTFWLIDDLLGVTTSLNRGALFGIGQGQVILFVSMSILATIGILYFLFVRGAATDGLLTVALGCVLAGILGNLYDRLGLPGLQWNGDPIYAVRDWIHFRFPIIHYDWPIFNIADSLLVCGAGLLMWQSWHADAPNAELARPATDDPVKQDDAVSRDASASV
jgi:signal peptidase II